MTSISSSNNTMPAFSLRSHSPDGAATDWGDKHLVAAYYSFNGINDPEKMKG